MHGFSLNIQKVFPSVGPGTPSYHVDHHTDFWAGALEELPHKVYISTHQLLLDSEELRHKEIVQ